MVRWAVCLGRGIRYRTGGIDNKKYRRMKYLIIIFLLCAISVNASPGWQASDQVWDCVYFMSAGIGTLYIQKYIVNDFWAAYVIMIIMSTIKEYCDQIYHEHGGPEHWFFDRRGGSVKDIGIAALSITISFPLRK